MKKDPLYEVSYTKEELLSLYKFKATWNLIKEKCLENEEYELLSQMKKIEDDEGLKHSKNERLKIYKKALFDYRLSSYFPFLKLYLNTKWGFCTYFAHKGLPMSQLPELLSQKPKNIRSGLWFGEGIISYRINCLLESIKLLEDA